MMALQCLHMYQLIMWNEWPISYMLDSLRGLEKETTAKCWWLWMDCGVRTSTRMNWSAWLLWTGSYLYSFHILVPGCSNSDHFALCCAFSTLIRWEVARGDRAGSQWPGKVLRMPGKQWVFLRNPSPIIFPPVTWGLSHLCCWGVCYLPLFCLFPSLALLWNHIHYSEPFSSLGSSGHSLEPVQC